ncbi:MAG: hypothetical protein AAGB46_00260 [Verrucomicrobiota bacterium]
MKPILYFCFDSGLQLSCRHFQPITPIRRTEINYNTAVTIIFQTVTHPTKNF